VPVFDNVLLSHADRDRIFSPGWSLDLAPGGAAGGPVLVDGFVAGTWQLDLPKGRADGGLVTVRPLTPWTTADEAAVIGEAEGLLAFVEAGEGRVELVRPAL
jgi:hypothetical protein